MAQAQPEAQEDVNVVDEELQDKAVAKPEAEGEMKPIGAGEDERQDIGGKPITQGDAAHMMSEAMKAGKEVKAGSLPARALSAASVNVRKGVIPPGPALGDVKPFDEEPALSDVRDHGQDIGGKPGEKRDIAGKLLTPEDASRIQKMEARLGHPRGRGSLTARVASAAAANVREGLVSMTGGPGTTPQDVREEFERHPPEEREKLRREVHAEVQRQQQSQ